MDPARARPTRQRRVRPQRTLGHAGVNIVGGYLEYNERDRALASPENRHRTFSDLLINISIVGAGVRYFLNLIGGATWTVMPAETPDGEMYAELIDVMLKEDPDTPWHRIIRRCAMYRFYGYSVQEWTAKRREDGLLTFLDIAPRAQRTIERWDVDTPGKVWGCWQRSPQSYEQIYLPRAKLLYLVDDTLHDSPEGLGLFRHLVDPGRRLRRYLQLEGMGFETDLAGIPIARGPFTELARMVKDEEIDEADRLRLEAPLHEFADKHIRTPNLGMTLDSSVYRGEDDRAQPTAVREWDIELLQGGATSFAENAAAIERTIRDIARILGVEQLLLGSDGGSYALSQDKTHAFYLQVDGALTEIREAVEKDLVDTLRWLNGWPEDAMPTLKTEAISHRDVTKIAAVLRDMATSGFIMDPESPVWQELLGLMGFDIQPGMILVKPEEEPDDDNDDDPDGDPDDDDDADPNADPKDQPPEDDDA